MKTWGPDPVRAEEANVTQFGRKVLGPGAPTDPTDLYRAVHRWSIDDSDRFWWAVWEYFDVQHTGDPWAIRTGTFAHSRWFPGVSLSFTEHLLRKQVAGRTAIWEANEDDDPTPRSWQDLLAEAAGIQEGLVRAGVRKGDRVGVVLPNTAAAAAAFIAVTGLGAVWVAAAPEFGVEAVLDRFRQVDPRIVIGCDGYQHAGRRFDTAERVHEIAGALGVELVLFRHLDGGGWPDDFKAEPAGPKRTPTTSRVPFDHPLWIVFTSGTTGKPKPLIHGHGGVLLEYLKHHHFHFDLRDGDCLFWYSTTGWIMWNLVVAGLLTGAAVVLYDGSPTHPSPERLWAIADRAGVTCFGSNPGFLAASAEAGVIVRKEGRLRSLRAIGSTGSPLPPSRYDWVYDQVGEDVWLFSTSGGTEVASALVCGVPSLPVTRGEIQGAALGVALESWSEEGKARTGVVGELVLRSPLPSMPLGMWGDATGRRLEETYFKRFSGVWTHGDWVTITTRGTVIIDGRSDATINRGGVRVGTSEIYQAVSGIAGVRDALAVDVRTPDQKGRLVLFLHLEDGVALDGRLHAAVRNQLRQKVSPRHVPDDLIAAPTLPRTISGKLLEIPVKHILEGRLAEQVVDPGTMQNPESLEFFVQLATHRASTEG